MRLSMGKALMLLLKRQWGRWLVDSRIIALTNIRVIRKFLYIRKKGYGRYYSIKNYLKK